MIQDIDLAFQLYYNYSHYIESKLKTRRFKHSDIIPLIDRLKGKNIFTIKEAGRSALGKPIYLIKAGKGKNIIFLWSQMHGDESTATMALFDIFNFLSADDSFNEFRNQLLKETALYFIPMLNPDGAEVFQRRNEFGIDINRDAIAQQTPEGRILKETFEFLKPAFGFNLHDQDVHYSAGHTFKPATISFLAPSEDFRHNLTITRSDAIKLINHIYGMLSSFIPGRIAKYPSEYEPRAFGDFFQKSGMSTILIESGGWFNDTEKQFIRKINFITLLLSLKSIIEQSYKSVPLEVYDDIPFNEKDLMDLIIRNVTYKKNGIDFKIDIGINRSEINYHNAKNFYFKSTIEDVGDLSIYFGYEDHDFEGMEIVKGSTCYKIFNSVSDLENLNFLDLYNEGFTNVILNASRYPEEFSALPINISLDNYQNNEGTDIKIGEIPNFIIKKNGKVRYVIINGFLIDIINMNWENKNGLVLTNNPYSP